MNAASLVPPLLFALDGPRDAEIVDGDVLVAGWCASVDGTPVALRVRAGDLACELERHLPRADVAAVHPGVPELDRCGFETTLKLGDGVQTVHLECRPQGGDWTLLAERQVQVRPLALMVSLDTPAGDQALVGPQRFSGWCVHPRQRVVDLALQCGTQTRSCHYALERRDVAAANPGLPGALHSGFDVALDLDVGTWPLAMVAVLDNGSELRADLGSLRVRPVPLWQRVAAGVRSTKGFVRFSGERALSWWRDNRRIPRPRELWQLMRMARELYGNQPGEALFLRGPAGFEPPKPVDPYDAWQALNRFGSSDRLALQRRLDVTAHLPRLSVVMPVYNPPIDLLRAAIDSVREQVYDDWELCIVDDASTNPAVWPALRAIADADSRVRMVRCERNGNISRASNAAAALASGDFLVFLDQDDLLTPDALGEIALRAAASAQVDIVYSDDDKIDLEGRRFAPQFKPDWSPELLLAYMYFSHVFAVRRSLFEAVGGMRVGFEGSQDYDFALRATEQAREIAHIPAVLYHWRVLPGSTAASGAAKPASFEAGRRAVQDALTRRGVSGNAVHPAWAQKAGVGIFGIEFPDDGPRVSLIIPTRNGLDILKRCIESLPRTTYRNVEVLIVDNESDDPATLEYLAVLPHRVLRIANPAGRFNYAWINNRAAEMASGEYVLFLNNDTEVVEPQWLSRMVGYAQMSGVGAVGARLLYPDGRIQHAGIVHGYYRGLAGPAFKLAPAWDNGYLSYARVSRNYSAVTAACLLTPRALFLELGGFDQVEFEVAYNDVDYCYRLAEHGRRVVYCAEAELLHYEGHTRGFCDRPQEVATFRRRYAGKVDPYYSRHLSFDDERFRIQPRRLARHREGPVRALMCAFNLNWEGAPHSQYELTVGLKRAGHIEPIVYSPSDGPLRAAYEAAGIPVHVMPHPLAGVFDTERYDAAIDGFARFVDGLGVDLVYGNTLQTFYAIDAAARLHKPSLWNPRESEPWQTYFGFLPPALAARALQCFAQPYRVIFVAEATRKVWAPLDSRGNFCVIHNGLDLSRLHADIARYDRAAVRNELGIADGEVCLFLPGTVCERKGQIDLVQALGKIDAALWPRLRVFMVGDRASAYSLALHRAAQGLPEGLRERLRIVSETGEILRYYRAADVFVCTSRVESFPRVVLEGMACGLPIVSTGVFGIREQVAEGVNALLYEPGDVARLAQTLARVVGDDAERARMAGHSPAMLATLNSYDDMIAGYAALFAEAAALAPQTATDR